MFVLPFHYPRRLITHQKSIIFFLVLGCGDGLQVTAAINSLIKKKLVLKTDRTIRDQFWNSQIDLLFREDISYADICKKSLRKVYNLLVIPLELK